MAKIKMPCPGGGQPTYMADDEPYEICGVCGRNLRLRQAAPKVTWRVVPPHSRNARYGGDL